MGKKIDKFRLLMWKNLILKIRKTTEILQEIVVPVILTAVAVYFRSTEDPTMEGPFFKDSSYKYPLYPPQGYTLPSNMILLYAPNNTRAQSIMRLFQLADLKDFFAVEGLKSDEEMEKKYKRESQTIFAGIYLKGLDKNKICAHIRFPSEIRVKVKDGETSWMTNEIIPQILPRGPRSGDKDMGGTPEYYTEGFLLLQYLLTVAVSLEKVSYNTLARFQDVRTENSIPAVYMHRFPYPEYYSDPFLHNFNYMLCLVLMFLFVQPSQSIVRAITIEKEKQLKETMKIMGLPNWLHWMAWFVKCFLYMLIAAILVVLVLKVKWLNKDYTIFTYTDGTVLMFFFILFICATITFCFAVSVFFKKAVTATILTSLVTLAMCIPFLLTKLLGDYELYIKMISSLCLNSAAAFGFRTMILYEEMGDGTRWGNIFSQATPDDRFTVGYAMIMLIVDTILYLLIALYVETVLPGEYGVPLPWYFPCQPSYWRGNKKTNVEENYRSTNDTNRKEFFEEEPKNLHSVVEIRNLTKVFGRKTAVQDLSLNMFENQITVLLGHNGAGKTTTMSMLTGMITPTSGTARVNGYDISSEMDKVRGSLGLCPQHNVIYDDLTVSEHLYFFSKLKGLSNQEVKEEVDRFLNLLEFEDKRNTKSSKLSGGMKRKLSVGIALCGKSKVVFLDEPTSGMDPSARRALWNLLQTQKQGRTILLTTHYMDEADVLGDRIAIMSGGRLQCCGSSFFLKKKYGAGYNLIIEKSHTCNVNNVTQLLRSYIPGIEFQSNIGSELTYLLPENRASVFENMLRDLEKRASGLGIQSFGISLTTLEEVFMKVGADSQHEDVSEQNNGSDKTLDGRRNGDLKLVLPSCGTVGLIMNQFMAMFLKKYIAVIRQYYLTVVQIILPAIFLLACMSSISNSLKEFDDLPPMPMNLDKFDNPKTLVQGKTGDAYFDAYGRTMGNGLEHVPDIPAAISHYTEETPHTVRRQYIAGATIEGSFSIVAWFNNDPYHSPGIAVGLVMAAIYNKFSKGNLEFINAPFPYSVNTTMEMTHGFNPSGVPYNLMFSMMIVTALYIYFPVKEIGCKSKHLQLVSGTKVWIFWITALICDCLIYTVSVGLVIIVFLGFQLDGFTTSEQICCVLAIFYCFAWAFLSFGYFLGSFYTFPADAMNWTTMLNMFTGMFPFMAVTLVQVKHPDVGLILHKIFVVLPHYAFTSALMNFQQKNHFIRICKDPIAALTERCKSFNPSYYEWSLPGIGTHITALIVFGAFFSMLLLFIDYHVLSRIWNCIQRLVSSKKPVQMPDEDLDVAAEKSLVKNSSLNELLRNNDIVIKDLTKYYGSFLAVNGLCLVIKKYECFGLLGVNGAGKTTTFKMLTGDVSISYGNAWIDSFSIKSQPHRVHNLVGYCPQFDALLEDMTARETLKMFALLRGIANSECNKFAEYLSKELDFHKHLDKKVKQLSGGNKRKLSASVSLVGDPPILFLDEPTAGMDPATRRYLWDVLCKLRDSGKCVVLTSHDMEECEALCTRLAIMVSGNFRCLGSTQHLKNKFSKAYTLTIKLKKGLSADSQQSVEAFVRRTFPQAQALEKHEDMISYKMTDVSIPCSQMFGTMERAKRENPNIVDYSLGQSSLEQVFLTFAKDQKTD